MMKGKFSPASIIFVFMCLKPLRGMAGTTTPEIKISCHGVGMVAVDNEFSNQIVNYGGMYDYGDYDNENPVDQYEGSAYGYHGGPYGTRQSWEGRPPEYSQLLVIDCSNYQSEQAAIIATRDGIQITAEEWKCIDMEQSYARPTLIRGKPKDWHHPDVLCPNDRCNETGYVIQQMSAFKPEVNWVGYEGQMELYCLLSLGGVTRDECAEGVHRCQQLCVDKTRGYDCACESGYYLDDDRMTCLDVDECQQVEHGCVGRCRNLQGSYICECPPGRYELSSDGRSCDDIDECEAKVCPQHCVNKEGGFECRCYEGYLADGDDEKLCKDIDECSVEQHGCQHHCVNTAGSYYCACVQGYELAADGRACVDIDECASDNHPCHHKCVNIRGDYHCACEKGQVLLADGITCLDTRRASPKMLPPGERREVPHGQQQSASHYTTTLGLAVSISSLVVVLLLATVVIVIVITRRRSPSMHSGQMAGRRAPPVSSNDARDVASGPIALHPVCAGADVPGGQCDPPLYIDLMMLKDGASTHDTTDLLQ